MPTNRVKKALSFYFITLFSTAVVALLLTMTALFQATDFFSGWAVSLIFGDFILIGLMVITIFIIAVRLILSWRRGRYGTRLSLRLTLLLLGMSLLPMAIVYTVSTVGILRNMESWFNTPLHRAFEKGIEFGRELIGHEFTRLEQTAFDIVGNLSVQSTGIFFRLDDIRRLHHLSGLVLYNDEGAAIFSSGDAAVTDDQLQLSESILRQIQDSGRYYNVIGVGDERDIEIVLAIPESSYAGALRVSRALPAGVAEGITDIENGHREYEKLLLLRNGLELSFILILTLTLVLILLFVTWLSLRLGRRLTLPMVRLGLAAEAVGRGDFTQRLEEKVNVGELAELNRSFNTMMDDLRSSRQQNQLRQQQLYEANTYMENLLSSLTTGVLTFSSDGALSGYNTAAEKLSNMALAEYVEKPKDELIALPFFTLVIDAVEQHPQTLDEISEQQIRFGTKILLLRVSLVPMIAGNIRLVIISDITDQVRAEREATWEEASKRFVHEIKNPLTPVQLAAERLEMKLSSKLSNEDAKLLNQMVGTIVNQVGAMQQMVNAFREYANEQKSHFLKVNINILLNEVRLLYEGRNVRLQTALQEPLMSVKGDAVLLRQVLHNLLGNACDAIANVGEPAIMLTTEQIGNYVRLTVEDNGGGIEEAMLEKIGDPYVSTKAQGTGLGLAVVRRTVAMHNGKLFFQNGSAGLRVVIDLPVFDEANRGA